MPFLDRPGARIHYVCDARHAGRDALVFVHGALCDHTDWQAQLAHFGGARTVAALDLRGHGQSSQQPGTIGVQHFAQDVQALCETLGLPRVILVGHSMGCRAVLQAYMNMPQRVVVMVLVDGAYLTPQLLGGVPREEREAMAQQARERAAALYEGQGPALRARRGFGQMFFDPRFDRERDRMVERAAALPGHVARELMPDFASWDLLHMEETLAHVKVPLLAIACTYMNSAHERAQLQQDQQTPWLQAVVAHVPQARVIRYTDSGHFPMIEDPGRVNADIEAFLAQAASAA